MKIYSEKGVSKKITLFKNPEKLSVICHPIRWEILKLLSLNELYPYEISKILKLNEQKVYYHIKLLEKAGIITVSKKIERAGSLAKYYKVTSPAFGIELPFGEIKETIKISDERLRKFLHPFIKDNKFDSYFVVGSPDPHGPNKARARDGHYVGDLALFLGQFTNIPNNFSIKLDVDVLSEKAEKNNLILIGGGVANNITRQINNLLPIQFIGEEWDWGIKFQNNTYRDDDVGFILKYNNPFDRNKKILVLAGNRAIGTKAAVIGLTRFWKKFLDEKYNGENMGVIVKGYDLDGDGKLDAVEILNKKLLS